MATATNPVHNGAAPLPAEAPIAPLLEIDRASREVLVRGREVRLTRLEFSLLEALAEHPAAIVSKERLLRDVWGYKTLGRTRDRQPCLPPAREARGRAARAQRARRRLPPGLPPRRERRPDR